jgi:hypothetical protein
MMVAIQWWEIWDVKQIPEGETWNCDFCQNELEDVFFVADITAAKICACCVEVMVELL